MGRPVRMYEEDGVYFVTARTLQARLLLRPSAELNEVVGGVLARAVQLHPVELYGYVFASNHVHLLLRARDGCLSHFMQYLLGNLSRKVGRIVDWGGTLWGRRFSMEQVLDDGAMVGRLQYILAHGVKEGLVRTVEEWPGLSCASQLLGHLSRTFKWFCWERRWRNGKLVEGGEDLFSEQWSEPVELELSVLPHWAKLDEPARRSAVAELIGRIEEEGRAAHPTPLGKAEVEAQDPHTRPVRAKRSPHPLCHTTSRELREKFLEAYRAFLAAYHSASARFRAGELLVAFPPLSCRPPAFTAGAGGARGSPSPPAPWAHAEGSHAMAS